jgi:hypothetical protein
MCAERCPKALEVATARTVGVGDLATPELLEFPPFESLYCTVEIGLLADALPHI